MWNTTVDAILTDHNWSSVSMSIVEEGFICPYCLVGFATSGKLQSHFVEMHSGNEAGVCCEGGEDPVGAPVGYGQLGEEEVSFVAYDPICMHLYCV